MTLQVFVVGEKLTPGPLDVFVVTEDHQVVDLPPVRHQAKLSCDIGRWLFFKVRTPAVPQRIAKGRDGWGVDAAVALLSRRFFVVHGLELVLCLFSLARLPPPCLIMFDGTITKPLLDFCTLLCFYNSDAISLMKLLLSFLPGAMGGGGDFGKGSFPDEWTTN